jgi:hypothetical protein
MGEGQSIHFDLLEDCGLAMGSLRRNRKLQNVIHVFSPDVRAINGGGSDDYKDNDIHFTPRSLSFFQNGLGSACRAPIARILSRAMMVASLNDQFQPGSYLANRSYMTDAVHLLRLASLLLFKMGSRYKTGSFYYDIKDVQ